MDSQEAQKRKRILVRSPSYPSIDLESSIGLAEIIKQKEGGGNHFVPYQAVVGHWGYKSGSGPGLLKLAALKKFGLIEDRGTGDSREIKLTELALEILFYKDSPEHKDKYIEALQKAALEPSIHNELWNKWNGNLPSDQTIRAYLIIQRTAGRFAESSVNNFINQFRDTISFSKLQKNDSMSGHEEDKNPKQQKDEKMNAMPTIQNPTQDYNSATIGEVYNIPIYLPSGKSGCITIPKPLSDEEWNQVIAIINVYKPSIVAKQQKPNIDEKEPTQQDENDLPWMK